MKKLDILLLKSFAGPFLVAFGVALFVLIMQFLWLYIDEIAGKGVSIFIMAELIGYMSVAVFPMALPIAVLISSVMVMGNLAERYELSSMKSAGVSLLRVLRPLIFVSIGIGFFSYLCSDFLIPKANLRSRSRLHDIRRTKPTLTLEKGIYNEDFRNFVIRIGDKEEDGETIGQVQLHDLTNSSLALNQIMADSGIMYTSDDRKFFVMELYRGTQYQEPLPDGSVESRKYPFIRTNFKSWNKIWNMSEFEMNRSDEDRFKSQRSMLSMAQLRAQIDSIQKQENDIRYSVGKDLTAHINRLKQYTPKEKPNTETQATSVQQVNKAGVQNSNKKLVGGKLAKASGQKDSTVVTQTTSSGSKYPEQLPLDSMMHGQSGFIGTFAEGERATLKTTAAATLRGHINSLSTRRTQIKDREKDRVKTAYELYSKYSFALVCVLFLFIGAPMGAIIRKGGFGWPVLISIIFFVIFIFLTIMCRELAESFVLHPFAAAMVPCAILVPIAAILTYRSLRDRTLIEFDFAARFTTLYSQIIGRFKTKSAHV
jgi:lipopolysaccharide export system permease protein